MHNVGESTDWSDSASCSSASGVEGIDLKHSDEERPQGAPVINKDDDYDEDAIVNDVPDNQLEIQSITRPRSLPFTTEEDAISGISLDRTREMNRLLQMIQGRLSLELRKTKSSFTDAALATETPVLLVTM